MQAEASVFSNLVDRVKFIIVGGSGSEEDSNKNSQMMDVLKPNVVDAQELNEAVIEDASTSNSLSATTGMLRLSTEDVDFPTTDQISVYEVKKGDTLASVAKMFGVSKNTIVWANDLKSNSLTVGDTIVILPITGIKHTVKKGETLLSIVKKYKADINDVSKFNGITKDTELTVGDVILVPEGEISVSVPKTSSSKLANGYSKLVKSYSNTFADGFLIRPVTGGRKTQGLHGYNGIDIGIPTGSPVMASGNGRIILTKTSGYNGGYGNMIIIAHDNNIQTVYAHLSKVNVSIGQTVSQGEVIGATGNTGHSTGPHLHFEVRGAVNPF